MGTVMHLPYTNNEIVEVDFFMKHGRGLNDEAADRVVREDEFGRPAADPPHSLEKFFSPDLREDEFGRKFFSPDVAKSGVADERWDAPMSASAAIAKHESPDVFLEKRSSAPGLIRLEVVEINGERVRRGYDHAGQLVFERILLPEIA
ncbi:MAG: hypothetical protein JWN63_2577 [Candidatus Acidoferrum typicum]|nr:hypothetical protein [Candidatus Acidoferrum typicum]